MAKKGSTIQLEMDLWNEIEQYQADNNLSTRNEALSRMLLERRMIINFMDKPFNFNINMGGTGFIASTTEDNNNNSENEEEHITVVNKEVENELDSAIGQALNFDDEEEEE